MCLTIRSPALNRLSLTLAAGLCGLLLLPVAQAAEQSYSFTGLTNVGASDGGLPSHRFTGLVTFDDAMPSSTVYLYNDVVQGFRSIYSGAVRYLGITLDNGERVEANAGWLQLNNIQQAENGAPVPQDLSLQVWTSGASGTINGLSVFNLYLAFLPVAPVFSWDALDSTLHGNAETLLQADPALLPANIDPQQTGTALPAALEQAFSNGLFLGTNHGLINTVNMVDSFAPMSAPVPEPGTLALMLAGGVLAVGAARRNRRAGAAVAGARVRAS